MFTNNLFPDLHAKCHLAADERREGTESGGVLSGSEFKNNNYLRSSMNCNLLSILTPK